MDELPVKVATRAMTRPELLRRKAELARILDVLTEYTLDGVCAELGEISYLLGELRAPVRTRAG
jgi:hypothetical protein